ncbi:MAG TPA: glycosyltransferase family 39 protein [Epsilonproteobacteria bacterium]|nr:glycosyltransferase family 39 protein [Campylobacterota bacterium]
MQITHSNAGTQFILFVVFITLYRAMMLYLVNPDMYLDEAYYWIWSQNLDWGYYSKPPMVAWFIAIATSLFGDSSLVIKSISLAVYPLTATMIYLSAKELFDEKIALYSGMLFFSLPAVSLSSMIISTDVVLLLFWSLTFFYFIRALNTNKMQYWILAGIFGGLGLLSKYNMILFVVSAFVYLIYSPTHRKMLTNKSFYLSLIIAAFVFLPNLIWNYNNEFISFVHLKEISQIEQKLFHFDKMFEFLGAQFGVFGPVSFGLLLYLFATSYSHRKDEKFVLLFLFTIVFLGVITL